MLVVYARFASCVASNTQTSGAAVTLSVNAPNGTDTRATPTLFVIVWHVPFTWEPQLDYDQLQVALDALTTEQRWPAIVRWPLGGFEMAKAGWVLNDEAKRMLQQAR